MSEQCDNLATDMAADADIYDEPPVPIDWPARFRAAAEAAAHLGHGSTASSLVDVAEDFDDYLPKPVREAIGGALLGEAP